MSVLASDELLARDMVIDSQPILWAQAMLADADKCRAPDARDAILARIGVALLGRFGMTMDWDEMRRATYRGDASPVREGLSHR